jgi:hypothetical protein
VAAGSYDLSSPTLFSAANGLPTDRATQQVWAAMQSDKQEAKWRDQFKKLGREAVRDKLHAGVYWRTRQGTAAERWLREQEAAEDSANMWCMPLPSPVW